MNKKKLGIVLLILCISIAIVAIIGTYVLDNSGKVNQGNFRISDFVVESTIKVVEKDVDEVKDLSSLVFDISQNNKITVLVLYQAESENMYIDNFNITNPVKMGNFYMTQNNYEEKFNLLSEHSKINMYPAKEDGVYKIEIDINNENCMQDVNVTSGTQSIRYDGTILSLLNTKVSDLRFEISFNLNIIDVSGKNNVCPIKLSIPNDDLMTNGVSITRHDVSKYIFTIKDVK